LRAVKSFSFVCTSPCEREAALLIYSIRRAGYECPILIVCDDATDGYLRQFGFDNVICRKEANQSQLPDIEVDNSNGFHKPSIILKKMDAMEWAIEECGNTMFIDADVVFLKKFDWEINQPTMLSPHYGKQASADKSGAFNAGYLYTEEPDLPERWRWLYINKSRFFEQECMSFLFESFDIGKFSKQHNIGFWRPLGFREELAISIHQHFDENSYASAWCRLKKRYDARRSWWIDRMPEDILCFMRDTKMLGKVSATKPKDDWGNYNIVFNESHYDGKFNLDQQPALSTHRGGWKKVLEAMRPLHNDKGIYCETFVESLFDWFRNKNEKNNHIPVTDPWVGFIHNPHNMPDWYNGWDGSGDRLFEESLASCTGLYTMSEYHAIGLRERYPDLWVESILHPYPSETVPMWKGNARQLVSVGWWLRRQASIYTVQVPRGWKKIKLWPYKKGSKPIDLLRSKLDIETDLLDVELPVIEHQYNLANEDYDDLLCNSVVLLDLWDTSANNTVLECIQREVPIVVRDHPAVREYLGDEYPLYFNHLDEVHGLLDGASQASAYLSDLRQSGRFTMETFIRGIRDSDIYRQA
tara:strand:+ start:26385 stop:28136 length:1752 start_codon:yes stop_codon:yes gene_type:complete